ncbi:hypothetical protein Tco_0621777 [Tanacetum coccineum]
MDFLGMPELMRDGLFARMVMEHRDDAGLVVFTSRAWGRLFDTRGPLVRELILEFLITLRFGEVLLDLDAPGTIQFQLGGARRRLSWRQFILALVLHTGEEMESPGFARGISTDGDFLGPPPSYTLIRDSVLRLCHRMMAHSIAGRSQAPEKPDIIARFAAGRKSGAHISGGHEIQICMEVDDTWAWVAIRPERQPDAVAGALGVAQDAPIIDVWWPADRPPYRHTPPAGSRDHAIKRMARLEGGALRFWGMTDASARWIDSGARDFSRFSTWAITRLAWMIDKAGVTYVPYSETHVPYQRRRVRQRTGEASTSRTTGPTAARGP